MVWIERWYAKRPGRLRRTLMDLPIDRKGLATHPRYARLLRVAGLEVDSAESGQLTVHITNQNGALVAASDPQTVPRGGGTFGVWTTFTIPSGTTQVCKSAVLQIGSLTLSAAPTVESFRCNSIKP
jgi:hypothetical protein